MKNIKLVLATLIVTSLAASAASSQFKIGNVPFKAAVDPVSTTITSGEDVTVSMTGVKAGAGGASTGTMTIILKGIKSQIVKGATFDVTTGQDVESGSVNLNFGYTSTASSGKSTILASDEESGLSKGSIKITAVDDDSFTATYNAKITNVLKTVTNPLAGDLTGEETRTAGTNISGKFSGAL